MSRISPEVPRRSGCPPSHDSQNPDIDHRFARLSNAGLEVWLLRVLFVVCVTAVSYSLAPFGLGAPKAAGAGLLMACFVLLFELRLQSTGSEKLLGGALGALLGLFAAVLVTLIVSRTSQADSTKSFLEFASLVGFGYLGSVLGSSRGAELQSSVRHEPAPAPHAAASEPLKLLDTSVLIDGRIADICEAHFLAGVIGVPRFVLHELQLVADSSDPLKRQRGRRGLDVLQRIQKMPGVEVRVLDDDSRQGGDVDHRLVDVARRMGGKIVTNDFNLNKVASVQGIAVLNVNQLANALKPAVLPGEPMRVLILREGKEANQGVAYLDDGTMVVVDGARKLINKSVDVIVTSVHQTTAGKMIFGRLEDRVDSAGGRAGSVAGGTGQRENGGLARRGSSLPDRDPLGVDRPPRRSVAGPAAESKPPLL